MNQISRTTTIKYLKFLVDLPRSRSLSSNYQLLHHNPNISLNPTFRGNGNQRPRKNVREAKKTVSRCKYFCQTLGGTVEHTGLTSQPSWRQHQNGHENYHHLGPWPHFQSHIIIIFHGQVFQSSCFLMAFFTTKNPHKMGSFKPVEQCEEQDSQWMIAIPNRKKCTIWL